MNTWNESMIRKELSRLDAKTGLNGSLLHITFNNAKRMLGAFSIEDGGTFCFSRYYFEDSSWPIEEALDTIRHEYAHYMDYVFYGNMGHGATWKKCCIEVGAMPIRCYSSERAKYYQNKHKVEHELSRALDGYRVGSVITHPRFGRGIILDIVGDDNNRYALVNFSEEVKKLSLAWVDKNCGKCA